MRRSRLIRLSGGLAIALLLVRVWPAMAAEVEAGLLIYNVESPGEESYLNRLLVTPDYLRLDKGARDSGFILHDRKQGVIYSVNHEDRSILVIDPPVPEAAPDAVTPAISMESSEAVDVPEVGGVKPLQWTLRVDGESCRQAFILPGLMAEAVTAYADYLGLLARQQAQALSALPAEFRNPCDDAVHVFAADALLRKGLPLNVWDDKGYRESLIDFRASFGVPEDDFSLPADYARVPMRVMF